MAGRLTIRPADRADADAICAIYNTGLAGVALIGMTTLARATGSEDLSGAESDGLIGGIVASATTGRTGGGAGHGFRLGGRRRLPRPAVKLAVLAAVLAYVAETRHRPSH